MKNVTVKHDQENPEPVEIIADAVIKIAEAMEAMRKSKLSRRAVVLLIQDNCRPVGNKYNRKAITKNEVEAVLDSIDTLKKTYIKTI